jgi:site-specific recombinase XerD
MKYVDVLNQYEQFLRDDGKSCSTVKNYVGDVVRFLKWTEADITQGEFNTINEDQFNRYQYCQYSYGLKTATLKRRFSAILSFVFWAQNYGLISKEQLFSYYMKVDINWDGCFGNTNTCNIETMEKIEKSIERIVNHAITRFPRWRMTCLRDAVIVLLLFQGLEVEEILNLTLKDLQISDPNEQLEIEVSNNSKNLVIREEHAEYFRKYLLLRPSISSSKIFINSHEKEIDSKTVQRALNRFTKNAGVRTSIGEIRKMQRQENSL